MTARKNDLFPIVATALLLMAGSLGCGAKDPPPPATVAKPSAGAKPPLQSRSSSTMIPPPLERLDFSGKKDPFRSYVVAAKTKLALPPLPGKQLPIQTYEVGQFKILGIITGLAENRAMVQDPSGKSYVIKAGALIGSRNGRLLNIKPNALEISEQYREDSGRISTKVVRLTLPRKE
jgi:type IV pilus assembly protein PilP